MGLRDLFDKVIKTVNEGAAKKRSRDAGNKGVNAWLQQRQKLEQEKTIAAAQAAYLAKLEAAEKRRTKKLETTANDKELVDWNMQKTTVAKARKKAASTTVQVAKGGQTKTGSKAKVTAHDRNLTAAQQRAAVAKNLLEGDK